jgi:hypothetical protein
MTIQRTSIGVIFWGCLSTLIACEQEKPKSESSPATAASATPAATPTPTPAPVPAPASPETSERPKEISTELTDERRAAVEAKYPSAKGFLVAKDLENKLKANKAIKDKKAAVSAFDKVAKGKWVLFAGPLVNLKDDSFDLGVVYTAQLPNDPIGMSRQFFEVTLSDVEAYEKDKFKSGNVVVVIAKYTGDGKASPGHEVVSSGVWK